MPGFPANVSVNEHQVCGFFVVQELGCERVSSPADQAFIGHGLHGPIYAQLPAGI